MDPLMLQNLREYRATGKLRPYTPYAVTLDKVKGAPPPSTIIHGRPRVRVSRAQSEQLRQLVAGGSSAAVDGGVLEGSWSAMATSLPELAARPQAQEAQRTATPDIFNSLSLDASESGKWAVDYIDQDIRRIPTRDGSGVAGGQLLGWEFGSVDHAACTKAVQLLGGREMRPPPAALLRADMGTALATLRAPVQACTAGRDVVGAARAQGELVVRLAQWQLHADAMGVGVQDGRAVLRTEVSSLAHAQLAAAAAAAAQQQQEEVKRGGGRGRRLAVELLRGCEALTAERALWGGGSERGVEGEVTRRLLHGSALAAQAHLAQAAGRWHVAHRRQQRALRLLQPLELAEGGAGPGPASVLERRAELLLAACATLSAMGRVRRAETPPPFR
jgi:hypothetical protein